MSDTEPAPQPDTAAHGVGRHIGSTVGRAEDVRLVTGRGQYLADLPVGPRLELAFLRATDASARIVHLDTTEAAQSEGVVAVYTAADMAGVNGPVPVVWQQPGLLLPDYPALAPDFVRYAGQPVAAVVASSRALAEDALHLIDVDYEPLPPVVEPLAALDPDAPIVHPQLRTNEGYRLATSTGDVATAFTDAPVVVEATLSIQRQTALPMECRSIMAQPGADGRTTVWATIQQPHLFRDHMAAVLHISTDQLHIVVPDLGGSFGAYYEIYPEDIVTVFAAMALNATVCYLEDRQESFLSTVHAREQVHRAALALTSDGRILGFRDDIVANLGAFVDYSGAGTATVTTTCACGPYDVPATEIELRCAFTNTVRVGAYRGFGMPEATFAIERMIDMAATRLQMDPVQLRLKNLPGPDRMPYTMATGPAIDSGDFPSLFESAKEAIGYDEFLAKRASPTNGAPRRRAGIGVAVYVELTGSGPSNQMAPRGYRSPGWEGVSAEVRRDGTIRVCSGSSHLGQGIRTGLSQIAADQLGVNPAQVVVITGDTDLVRHGNRGSIGSRSAVVAGNAAHGAAVELAAKIKAMAAGLLEVDAQDLVLHGGRVSVRGADEVGLSFRELAEEAFMRQRTAVAEHPMLEAISFYDPTGLPASSGVHAARVEVDVETGEVEIVDYVIVHDCGVVINPALVDGQVLGGTAQGIGGALLEELVYDANGQLKTASMMDYLVPTAAEMPTVKILHQETRSPLNPLGVKGAGEAGTIAPPAALANAVSDALGVPANHLPLSPATVWRLARQDHDVAGAESGPR